MSMEERVIIQQDDAVATDSPNNPFLRRNRCCFHFPCFSPSPSTSSSSSSTTRHVTLGGGPPNPTSPSSLWDRFRTAPIRAFNKIREWSEIVAGPQWKTFIRRFNRRRQNHRHHHHHNLNPTNNNNNNNNGGKFQYDPLSYALNFDEGQNGHFDEDFDNAHYPDFSARLAASPHAPPTELGNGAPAC